jgi:hypothetical protein
MQAIEKPRGEARVWTESCVALEGQRKMDAPLLEISPWRQALEHFKCQGNPLAAADTQRHDPSTATAAPHGVQQTGRQDRTGSANGVPVCDRATFDVDHVFGEAEFAQAGERDRGERFIDLDSVDIAELPASTCQRLTDRGYGAQAEKSGLDGGNTVAD